MSAGSGEEEIGREQQADQALRDGVVAGLSVDAALGVCSIGAADLDDLLGGVPPESNVGRVETAIAEGVQGRMPAGILQGIL